MSSPTLATVKSRKDGARESFRYERFQHLPLGRDGRACFLRGHGLRLGRLNGVKPTRLASHWVMTVEIAALADGSDGIDVSGLVKLKALVMSPTVARRHAERFGTSAPKRVSRKRRSEVWSKRSDEMNPPRLNGEMTNVGTRKPRPMGPGDRRAAGTVGSGTAGAVTYSPGVPGRCGHRRHVIEEAAVLIVGHEQSAFWPMLIGLAMRALMIADKVALAEQRWRWRMIGVHDRRDDPRHLREISRDCVSDEIGWELRE